MRPFELNVPEATLRDLRERLARTRWDGDATDDDWDAGISPAYLRSLVEHWRTRYAWRVREAEINRLPQQLATVRDVTLHFVHARGRGPAPLPIILTHGFPDSFLRFRKLVPLLADPAAHGGDAADAFDVVVPSLPGFGFSGRTPDADVFHIADLWNELMTGPLGYERYGAHGGDWGSLITEHLARHTRSVVGIHLTDVPFWLSFQKPRDLGPAEEAYLAAMQKWQETEGAYAMIQGTRPGTLADGLNDSPAGLAAWIVDMLRRWSDCGGDLETRFSKDEILDQVMIYWITASVGSSFLPYHDVLHTGIPRWILEKGKELVAHQRVPAGFAMFPRDLSHPPREWAERFFQVRRWTEMSRGGHFAALEEPELLAEELRAFFRPLRPRH